MNATITGGAGFIGGRLASRIPADQEIIVLDDLSSGDRSRIPESAKLLHGSILDRAKVEEAAAEADVIFHLAARIRVAESMTAPAKTNEVNVAGTLEVLEAARRRDARVVFASSAAVYGNEGPPSHEDAALRPASPYAASKIAGEAYCNSYAAAYGLHMSIVRFFNVYGPGQDPAGPYGAVIPAFLQAAMAAEPIHIHGDGEQSRDFLFVDDAADALLAAARGPAGTYNIGTGRAVTINEVADSVEQVTGSRLARIHGEPRAGDVEHSRADTSRASTALGFTAATDLADGLAQTHRWSQNRAEARQ